MVRGWADEADSRGRAAGGGDDLVDLVAGQFAPFARLGPLGDFDLMLVGIGEIPRRDAKAAAGDLFDGRAAVVGEAFVVFAPFARIRLAADFVHGDGDGCRVPRRRWNRSSSLRNRTV